MNLKIKWSLILIVIFLVVSITPAFAVKMGEVADDAQNYNMESQKKKGFFAKIKFMAKGFKLIDKAKSAEKDSDVGDNNRSDGNEYESLWNQNQLTQQQTQKLLEFRNSEKTELNPINSKNPTNYTKNNTNTTTNTTNTLNPDNRKIIFPRECEVEADNLINQLATRNITLTKKFETDINNSLTGNIVQIIDEKGHLRYLYVKKITDTTVTLVKTDEKEITMTLKEFKKSYTGIVLLIQNLENLESIISQINKLQKEKIQSDTENAQKLKNKSKTATIINWILTGVGLLLFIIGVIVGILFAKPTASTSQVQMTEIASETGSDVSSDGYISTWLETLDGPPEPPSGGGTPIPTPSPSPTPIFTASKLVNSSTTSPQPIINSSIPHLPYSPGYKFKIKTAHIKLGFGISVGVIGAIIAIIAGVEIGLNISSNNWIRVILGIVGLILILVGVALIIYGMINGFDSVGNLITSYDLLKKLKNDSNDMDEWLKTGESRNGNETAKNSTINLNNTPLYNNTNHGGYIT